MLKPRHNQLDHLCAMVGVECAHRILELSFLQSLAPAIKPELHFHVVDLPLTKGLDPFIAIAWVRLNAKDEEMVLVIPYNTFSGIVDFEKQQQRTFIFTQSQTTSS